jgi:tight adherence protein B
MTLQLLAILAGACTTFVAVGALAGGFGSSRRQLIERVVALQRQRPDARGERSKTSAILKPDALASHSALAALLRRSNWAVNRALLLEQGAVPLKVSELLVVWGALAAILGVAVTVVSGLIVVGLAFAAFVIVLLELWVRGRARKRSEAFDRQLPVALEIMSTSLKSGFGIMESMLTVGRDMDAPLSVEFDRVINETRVGGSFEDALMRLVERVASKDFRIVARALGIHRTVGGDLAMVLDSVSTTMRERDELRGHIAALTAQQRLGGVVVGLLPLWVVGFLSVFDPDFISPLWTEPIGRLMAAGGLVMEGLAFLVMSRIMKIEV